MFFEGRELKLYSEPVSSSELQEGAIYFFVNFVDEQMLIPMMETVVFIGRNRESGDVGRVYFQDIESYREGTPYDWDTEDGWAKFQSGSENELGHVFNYEKALEVLLRCSLRRNEAGI